MKKIKRKCPKWTTEEDTKLCACVSKYGPRRWDWISQKLGTGKSGNSCRLRWVNYLREGVVRTGFTDQEKHKILLLRALGNGWSEISRHMPGRSDNAIKNYWNTQLTREARELGLEVASEEFLKIMTERYANSTANLPPESSYSPPDFRSDAESSYPPSAFEGGGGESSSPSAFGGGGGCESSSPPAFGGGGESSCTTITIPPSAFGRGGESSYALHPSAFGGGGESSWITLPPLAFGGGAFAELSPLSFDFSLELDNDDWGAPLDANFEGSAFLGSGGTEACTIPLNGPIG
ncbi:hypothetical protein ACS0TY_023751 [Phlomoides rotata]